MKQRYELLNQYTSMAYVQKHSEHEDIDEAM